DLAIWSEKAGAQLILNELSTRRAEILRDLFPNARVFTENAEQINNVLPDDAVPTVVVMNPPFSATAGRVQGKRDTNVGALHVEQALKRLAKGGRLVAIVGEGMGADRSAFKDWWKKIQTSYNVRANIGISGQEYAKYGTTFDNQILVIDKTGPTTGQVVTGKVDSVDDLPQLLEAIRNDRAPITEQVATEPASIDAAETNRLDAGAANATGGGAADAVGAGGKSTVRSPGVGGRGNGQRASDLGQPDSQSGAGQPGATDATADANGQRGRVPGRPGQSGTGRGGGDAAGGTDLGTAGAAGDSASGLTVGATEREKASGEITDAVFENYQPQRLKIPGAKAHPGKLVQSSAMSAVEPPAPTYTPNLPAEVIKDGLLSLAQLEAIVYAGQAHSETLPNGERRGFFIGDGTGVGKGREISGIILDNLRQGRKKAVWISFSEGLINDAMRDFSGVGGNEKLIFWQGKTKPSLPITAKDGILFSSYSTLKSAEKKQANDQGQKQGRSRLDQIVEWLGPDFDGVIAFDEAHKMGNVIQVKGKRGMKKPSQQAIAGVNLQRALPKARIVYVSATGATEVSNLGYASRLGLWGEGTAFADVKTFIGNVAEGGVAAMELISRDMKALGMYIARSLSFDGVTYERLEHQLTPLQTDMYDTLARAWQGVLKNVNAALEITDGAKNGNAKSAAMAGFWGAHQRFFNQVITALQTPTVIEDMQKQIAAGNAVVVQLTNTNEATQEREVAKAQADGVDLEELDFTPRQTLIEYVTNSFPVQAYQQSTDADGNTIYVPVMDAAGNPVFDKDAIALREKLLSDLQNIRVPGNPIDEIIQAFGSAKVAEVTGRKRRFVQTRDEDGNLKVTEEKRGKHAAQNDAAAFQGDTRDVLIFSEAGGTGFSFHADNTAKNQRRRIHYILQPGWRADTAVQGFGRTHRTNQASEPAYMLPTTNLKAQKRFVSSIARRLDQLGALTRGQRQATSQGLFTASDNLESKYAEDALEVFFSDLYRGATSLNFHEVKDAMGLDNLIDKKTGGFNTSNVPEIPQFLNRLLSLESAQQDAVFGEFEKRLDEVVEFAIQNGVYDNGLQTLNAQSIKKVRDEVALTDQRTGAQTRFVEVDVTNPVKYRTWAKAKEWAADYGSQFAGWFKSPSGRVFGMADLGERVNSKGETAQRGVLIDIQDGSRRYIDNAHEIKLGYHYVTVSGRAQRKELASKLPEDAAKVEWDKQVAASPKTRTDRTPMIVGVVLPIWDRVKGHPRIVRLQTDEGERMIGRLLSAKDVPQTLKNLGIGSTASKLAAGEVMNRINAGDRAILANQWEISKAMVSGENRIEIKPVGFFRPGDVAVLRDQGAFLETISWRERAFIPTGDEGKAVLARIMASKPVVDLLSGKADNDADLASRSDEDSRGQIGTGQSVAAVRAEIAAKIGRTKLDQLERMGLVNIHETASTLPERGQRYPDVTGWFDGKVIHLVAGNMEAGKAAGIF
ncbi:MAG TPA: strawberry notch family protein, partial [Rhodocyclaceae bacterium]|nr:strawberry notch family protein [Rhodocyclaceae bacterium]